MIFLSLIEKPGRGEESILIVADSRNEALCYAEAEGQVLDLILFSHKKRAFAKGVIAVNKEYCPYYNRLF